ncbi:terminase [Aeromonas sp. CA23]|uniref:terminase large subunit domain-containing protein n=1 Tax=Aeromonas sp. CA23 TaxID=2033032 RepID=UPI000BFDE30B|nr:terminase family protein [Aeromonas sp. CA23]ATL98498.1 terminase [Aeromonas sp. CA23]
MKNDISQLTEEHFHEWICTLFGYQLRCREAKLDPALAPIRNVLKAHQVGMSYYFAGEAFEDAVLTGDNQIFLAETPEMADVYRTYVSLIAKRFLGVTLTGCPIVLSNGAEIHFLSLDDLTFAGKSGHVYVDEYFWIPDFGKALHLAGALAMHKRWRKTYCSTLSERRGMARNFWSGDHWKNLSPGRDSITFPGESSLRDGGQLCPDRQWRYVITIEDAVRLGCNLMDIDELKDEYSQEAFNFLFMCQFKDSQESSLA